MKYAILGDIHANLEALQSVLGDAETLGVTHYACVGDIVGYNANPQECLKIIRELNCTVVQGNHDYYASCNEDIELFAPSAQRSIQWTRKNLSSLDRKYLRRLPIIADAENFTLVHSSLNNPHSWSYIIRNKAANANFQNQFKQICFYGHTHIPMAFVKNRIIERGFFKELDILPGRQYLINAGSVGQPRDLNPHSAYVVYDVDNQKVIMRRVPYDIKKTQMKIRAAGLPFHNALRLEYGR